MLSSWKDVLTDKGYVRVNEHLEVHGHPGVFAVGDIVDWPEQKQAAKAMWHAPVAAANVLSFVQGKPPQKVYKGAPELIMVSLGKVRTSAPVCAGLELNMHCSTAGEGTSG